MQVFPLPVSLATLDRELAEGAFQCLEFSALSSRGGILVRQLFQIVADQSGQRRVTLHRNSADLFDQLVVEGKRDIHAPIIRESLNMCNPIRPALWAEHRADLEIFGQIALLRSRGWV